MFNQDPQREFERREADHLDRQDRSNQESRILGTPSPSFDGVVNVDDPGQAAQLELRNLRVQFAKLNNKFGELALADYKKDLALRSIAESVHCKYEANDQTPYGKGVTDGHRFCAELARKCLETA